MSVIVRVRVRRGGMRKHTIRHGRRAKRKGISKITMAKSIQRTKAVLERGTLRSRLGDLAGGKQLRVDTPSARAELRAGVIHDQHDALSR